MARCEQAPCTTFDWDIFILATETQAGGGKDGFGSPDGHWADPDGKLFTQTDGTQPKGANDQMLVADTKSGEIRRRFTGVRKAEVTGIAVTPDRSRQEGRGHHRLLRLDDLIEATAHSGNSAAADGRLSLRYGFWNDGSVLVAVQHNL